MMIRMPKRQTKSTRKLAGNQDKRGVGSENTRRGAKSCMVPTVRCPACGDSGDSGDGTPCTLCDGTTQPKVAKASRRARVQVAEPTQEDAAAVVAKVKSAKTPKETLGERIEEVVTAKAQIADDSRKAKAKAATPAEHAAAGSKMSALGAAHQVLTKAKQPMNAKALIDAMASAGLWVSPGGKTPHATLHSALSREAAKDDGRFAKGEVRGTWVAR